MRDEGWSQGDQGVKFGGKFVGCAHKDFQNVKRFFCLLETWRKKIRHSARFVPQSAYFLIDYIPFHITIQWCHDLWVVSFPHTQRFLLLIIPPSINDCHSLQPPLFGSFLCQAQLFRWLHSPGFVNTPVACILHNQSSLFKPQLHSCPLPDHLCSNASLSKFAFDWLPGADLFQSLSVCSPYPHLDYPYWNCSDPICSSCC